jgi:regulator of RNase E activity RraA
MGVGPVPSYFVEVEQSRYAPARSVADWPRLCCQTQMTHQKVPSATDIEKLSALDTCTVSNAIERLNVRLRNEGFASGAVRCQFRNLPPMIGYAATGRIRTTSPPMTHRCYHDRMDWWSYMASLPKPSVMVLQDADPKPGLGAFVGEIHAAIGLALKCVGCVTNGAVRNLPAVKAMGFQLFAGSVSVSHSYAHIIDFVEPVEIGGLRIQPGDLIHGDRHGVLTVPLGIAADVPAAASNVLAEERELTEFCSLEELAERLRRRPVNCDLPWRPR